MQHYPMLARNLLYTGVTRGKQLVALIGQPKALPNPSGGAVAAGGEDSWCLWHPQRMQKIAILP
jgi:hypothetical protein